MEDARVSDELRDTLQAQPVAGLSRSHGRALWRLFVFVLVMFRHAGTIVVREMVGRSDRRRVAEQGQRWAKEITRRLGVRVRVEGDAPSGALLLANHRSYIDIAAVLFHTPCVMLAKAEVSRWPLLGFAARVGNTVFVERENQASRDASREALGGLLREGLSVTVFPEGTTFAGPGILPFRSGMFRLAAAEGLDVVPVAISYADRGDAWVGEDTFLGHFFTCFAKERIDVYVRFGPALRGTDWKSLKEQTESWVRSHLCFEDGEI